MRNLKLQSEHLKIQRIYVEETDLLPKVICTQVTRSTLDTVQCCLAEVYGKVQKRVAEEERQ